MLFKAIIVVGTLASSSFATVYFAKYGGHNVAYLDRNNACDAYTTIVADGVNPCEIPFTLANGYTYMVSILLFAFAEEMTNVNFQLHGCGGPLWLTNADGSFNSDCKNDFTDMCCDWACIQRGHGSLKRAEGPCKCEGHFLQQFSCG